MSEADAKRLLMQDAFRIENGGEFNLKNVHETSTRRGIVAM